MSYPPNRRCEGCGTRYWAEGDQPCPECEPIRVGDVVRMGEEILRVSEIDVRRGTAVVLNHEAEMRYVVPLDRLSLVRRGDDGRA